MCDPLQAAKLRVTCADAAKEGLDCVAIRLRVLCLTQATLDEPANTPRERNSEDAYAQARSPVGWRTPKSVGCSCGMRHVQDRPSLEGSWASFDGRVTACLCCRCLPGKRCRFRSSSPARRQFSQPRSVWACRARNGETQAGNDQKSSITSIIAYGGGGGVNYFCTETCKCPPRGGEEGAGGE